MRLTGKVIVVTGGANGIGRALVERFHKEKPAGIVVADIDDEAGKQVAAAVGGLFVRTNVREEREIQQLVDETRDAFGRVDVFCSNAGVFGFGGPDAPDEVWQLSWEVNFNPHVYAARAVLPEMLERGEGYLLQTVSSAGLLSNPGAAPYTVTKHAALGFAEWLSITYHERGIRVSAICPEIVRTNLFAGSDAMKDAMLAIGEPMEPEQVAEFVIEGMDQERFLILPHPDVGEYFRRKGDDHERWLRGMRRLNARVMGTS
ncbi:MAG TPA: SDR family oxidoreductase [Actinomycetota bacterium]|jgi:NAD(P)-dependent dehydrogenase (short-subunit alcohol dehydrogenase family)